MITGYFRKRSFHEAGHAAEAIFLAVPFKAITIQSQAESLGRAVFAVRPKWALPDSPGFNEGRARVWIEKTTRVAFAGQIAAAIHAGWIPAHYSRESDYGRTFDNAVTICSSEDECSAWLNWLFIRSRDQLLLPAIWSGVGALAETLMRGGIVSAADAQKIFDAAIAESNRGALDRSNRKDRSATGGHE